MKTKNCLRCHTEFSERRSRYCSIKCAKIVSPETKQKISESRKKFLKKNPDKHPWRQRDKFVSVPCEKIKEALRANNISFVEEWIPLDDMSYSIDIAFPDIKLGIEINGNQHYNSDWSLRDYYQERHNKIEGAGWKILEIHYSQCFYPDNVLKLIELGEQPDYSEYFETQRKRVIAKEAKKPLLPGVKHRMKTDIKYRSVILAVENSDIDFSKFGWVSEVSKIIGITPPKVNLWVKRHMKDFYEDRCFKRKR